MATLKYRDPVSGQWIPILGGMTQEEMDPLYLSVAGGTLTGPLTVLAPTADNHAATKSYVDTAFTGVIMSYAGSAAPAGWLLCQGQAVSRTTYANLFAKIGTTYGVGDGSTTFGVPNLKGRIVAGVYSSNTNYATVGKTGGAKTVTLAKSQVPNATGSISMHNSGVSTQVHTVSSAMTSGSTPSKYRYGYINSGSTSVTYADMNLGFGGGSHSNIQPYISLHYIIRT